MPELPEVETVRRSLAPLVGRRILTARLIRSDICTTAGGGDLLTGATVRQLERRGKRLAIIAHDGRALVIHLGMTGQVRLNAAAAPELMDRHIHAMWSVEGGQILYFRDPRRFGGLWTFANLAGLYEHLNELGPDALTIRSDALRRSLGSSHRAIKAALLDQYAVAGIGNIYADESLFAARIRPTRRADRLTREEWIRLGSAVRQILRRAVRARGSTLRNYADASGRPGQAQQSHAVYGRAGESCVRCGTKLRGIRLAQRATVFCPRCQT